MQLHDAASHRLCLTADERRALMTVAARAPRPVRTLCAVLHDTGYRVGEALALTPARIDLGGWALVFETLKKRRQGVYRAVPVLAPKIRSNTSCSGLPAKPSISRSTPSE